MKNFVFVFLFLLSINLFIPVGYGKLYVRMENFEFGENNSNFVTPSPVDNTVTLFDASSDGLITLDVIDYLVGAAACEMPALYESEAIKAQMVAIHSYYNYCLENPEHINGGYITVNPEKMTGYRDKNKLQEFWGMSYYDYYNKFLRCANEVHNEILTYKNKPALASYYAISCGKTADSGEIWTSMDYLKSVESDFDRLSEDYLQIKEYAVNELYTVLKSNFPFLEIKEANPEEWFSDIIYHDSGYAKYIPVGIDKIPGDQFRTALNLPSSCIMVFLEDDVFSIVTKGYGHGVGMSQYGANQLSQQGYDYKKILQHYYPGTEISEI